MSKCRYHSQEVTKPHTGSAMLARSPAKHSSKVPHLSSKTGGMCYDMGKAWFEWLTNGLGGTMTPFFQTRKPWAKSHVSPVLWNSKELARLWWKESEGFDVAECVSTGAWNAVEFAEARENDGRTSSVKGRHSYPKLSDGLISCCIDSWQKCLNCWQGLFTQGCRTCWKRAAGNFDQTGKKCTLERCYKRMPEQGLKGSPVKHSF